MVEVGCRLAERPTAGARFQVPVREDESVVRGVEMREPLAQMGRQRATYEGVMLVLHLQLVNEAVEIDPA